MAKVKVDQVTVEVLSNAFMSIAEEMGMALIRSSYSANIKERRDCSCAILNAKGESIGQAEHIPIHLGSMLTLVENILKHYKLEDIEDGDMFMANDPYNGGGTHLPDIALIAPVFYNGKIVAWCSNIAHHSDIGGRAPGSITGDSTSIFQEGLRIPPVRFIRRGEIVHEIMDMILLNCRTGFERGGDLMGQVSGNIVGSRRIVDVFDKYGEEVTLAGMDELMNYGERKMRAGIKAIPDGEYSFTDYMDDDGNDLDTRIPICVKITVKDDEMTVDFTGTSKQVKGAINCVVNATKATVFYSLKSIIDSSLPPNAGFTRPIRIIAPEGTIVNPKEPAAVGARTDVCQRIADVIFGALGTVLPHQVMAGCNSAVTVCTISGNNPRNGKFFVNPESLGGGFGARWNKDGLDGVHVHITNTSNLPVECLEQEYPLRIERYEIREDSGGAGKYRGGLGYIKDYRTLVDDSSFGSHGDRQKVAPWGIEGGLEGEPGCFILNPYGDAPYIFRSGKNSGVELHAGDIISVHTPGSGGYGNPFERDPEKVLYDVKNHKVSLGKARELYGVILNEDTMTVDYEATARCREQR